ncbi:MAG: mandelate racemase/muconate lactonizing enzyme family protein, partial [Oscillospiraceae bacterium]|nr:mandelate racemase/muconate lactonizing enzyme family protein [Oscillospiraceae bacterium]
AYGLGAEGAYGMLLDLSRVVINRDPFDVEPVWSDMLLNTSWGMGAGAIFFSAMSALNIAMMDIKGKALKVPCYQLLGGKYRTELRTYASQLQVGWTTMKGPYGKTDDYVRVTEHALNEGFDAVKLDVIWYDENAQPTEIMNTRGLLSYKQLALADERLRAIRKELGYNFDILIENHARTGTAGAIQMASICEKYKVFAYEETTMPLNPELHKVIAKKTNIPLADGERIFTRWGFMNFLKDNSVQLIQPDVCNCGGLTEAKKICDIADVYDAYVQGHSAGSPLSTAACLQLHASIPNFCIHELHFRSTQKCITDMCKYNYQPVHGKMFVPDLPGLGQEFNESALDNAIKHDTVDSTWSED